MLFWYYRSLKNKFKEEKTIYVNGTIQDNNDMRADIDLSFEGKADLKNVPFFDKDVVKPFQMVVGSKCVIINVAGSGDVKVYKVE